MHAQIITFPTRPRVRAYINRNGQMVETSAYARQAAEIWADLRNVTMIGEKDRERREALIEELNQANGGEHHV